MPTFLTDWLMEVSYDIPVWGVIILILFSLLFLYLITILAQNIFNIIAMSTTPIAKLTAGKVVEVKGKLKGRETIFQSPFEDKKLAFLSVEIGCFYDDNRSGNGTTREEILGIYQKGDELFNIKDDTGEVLVAHHTFLNKALEIKKLEYTNDEMPQQLLELFPEIRQHLIKHKQSFFLKIQHLEHDKKVMVTGQVVRASINELDSLAIYGGVGGLKQWQKDLMQTGGKRDFHSDRLDEVQLYTDLNHKMNNANSFNINYGSEGVVVTKKLFQLIFALIFVIPFSVFSFMVAYYKFFV